MNLKVIFPHPIDSREYPTVLKPNPCLRRCNPHLPNAADQLFEFAIELNRLSRLVLEVSSYRERATRMLLTRPGEWPATPGALRWFQSIGNRRVCHFKGIFSNNQLARSSRRNFAL
jgi:hypothetical protein